MLIAACARIPEPVADLVIAWAARAGDLDAHVKELTRQLQQNRRNGSKPPSRDGCERPAPKIRREKSGKASGGQPGHDGAQWALRHDPDSVVVNTPTHCEQCGESLDNIPVTASARRQVCDWVARMEVSEHQAETIACPAALCQQTGLVPAVIPYISEVLLNCLPLPSNWFTMHMINSAKLSWKRTYASVFQWTAPRGSLPVYRVQTEFVAENHLRRVSPFTG